jgi:TrmH family RNA methyltransferase
VAAYFCPQLADGQESQPLLRQLEQLQSSGRTRLYTVTPEVYAKLAVRESSGGVLLLLPYLETSLDALQLCPAPLLAVVENAEKPGNLGAILRTADAAGVDAVRASLGTIFSMPIAQASSVEVAAWLHGRGIRIAASTPEGATRYTDADLSGPLAIVLGSEAHGLTSAFLSTADLRLVIPMRGQADSLNLSASAAILLFEAVRQRGAAQS